MPEHLRLPIKKPFEKQKLSINLLKQTFLTSPPASTTRSSRTQEMYQQCIDRSKSARNYPGKNPAFQVSEIKTQTKNEFTIPKDVRAKLYPVFKTIKSSKRMASMKTSPSLFPSAKITTDPDQLTFNTLKTNRWKISNLLKAL